MGPTGGEPDRTGPRIIDTTPANSTTNFRGDEIQFEFNEFIDRNSFRRNVSIEPDLSIDLEYSFKRKTATVEFKTDLPENTTIVIKVGVDVTDTDRNKMGETYDLAIATGDEIDTGEVTARLIDAETGMGESGRRVFLYREPADFTQRANYVAQSDTGGNISFRYLSSGEYKAIWVEDVNRNRIWDLERERAQPFSVNTFEVQQDKSIDLGNLYYTIPDTLSPAIEGVGLLSERRLRLRMTETVNWTDSSYLSVNDTLGIEFTKAYPLYLSESDPNVLFAESESALDENQMYTLQPLGLTDKAGNSLEINFEPFAGSSEPDTIGLRTISHNSGNGLFPDEALEISYSKFIDDQSVVDSLLVSEGDQMVNNWPAVETDRNILKINPRNSAWESGIRYEFRVWNPWQSERERINPEFWQRNQLGGIEIFVENTPDSTSKRLMLSDRDNSITADTTFTGSEPILLDNLPPLQYMITIYEDINGNNKWDSGSIEPYIKPEPYIVRLNIPVREGFTSEVNFEFSGPPIVTESENSTADEGANEIELNERDTNQNE